MSAWWAHCLGHWASGGILLLPLAAVCLGIWGLFFRSRERMIRTLREGEALRQALAGGDPGVAAQRMSGSMAAWLGAVLDDVRRGVCPRAAFAARESHCLDLLRRDLLLLAALTGMAPLLGLLGTVGGMIHTFEAVASAGPRDGSELAGGIQQALITTQFGLVIALPGMFGLARLQRLWVRARAVMAECRTHALRALADERGRPDPA